MIAIIEGHSVSIGIFFVAGKGHASVINFLVIIEDLDK